MGLFERKKPEMIDNIRYCNTISLLFILTLNHVEENI